MTLHFTLILQVNTHCIAKYIDPKMSSNSFSEHLFFKIFLGGACPQTPLTICMLRMLIMLHTIAHNHSCTMILLLDYVAWVHTPSYAHVNINIDISGYRPCPNHRNHIVWKHLSDYLCMYLSHSQHILDSQQDIM